MSPSPWTRKLRSLATIKPAQAADLKAGVRVVVDVPEGSKTKLAHSVKIGAAAKAVTANDHDHDHDSSQVAGRLARLGRKPGVGRR